MKKTVQCIAPVMFGLLLGGCGADREGQISPIDLPSRKKSFTIYKN